MPPGKDFTRRRSGAGKYRALEAESEDVPSWIPPRPHLHVGYDLLDRSGHGPAVMTEGLRTWSGSRPCSAVSTVALIWH
jgi:hypothetical protein